MKKYEKHGMPDRTSSLKTAVHFKNVGSLVQDIIIRSDRMSVGNDQVSCLCGNVKTYYFESFLFASTPPSTERAEVASKIKMIGIKWSPVFGTCGFCFCAIT